MVSRAKDTHTTNRVVRVPDEDWETLGKLVGERNRAQVLREFIAWYLHRPKAAQPKRPLAEREGPDLILHGPAGTVLVEVKNSARGARAES